MDDVVNFLKTLGVGCRHPKDEFFQEGNDINKVHRIFGVHEIDDEEFYHKSYSHFSCQIPGCTYSCEAVYEYEQHYNSCHRFECGECRKYLPSSHLLDLHLMETHDAYFSALSEKKPMFQCYVKECNKIFKLPEERRDHCITEHKFPSNFRFDAVKKKQFRKKNNKLKQKNISDVEMSNELSDTQSNMKMEISEEINVFRSKPKHKNISYGGRRKPVLDLDCFVKDIKDSLPS